jgi:hypothetical protein
LPAAQQQAICLYKCSGCQCCMGGVIIGIIFMIFL